MIRLLLFVFIMLPAGFSHAVKQPWEVRETKPPVTIYVAPNGSDSNSGEKSVPFATLKRAQVEVRKHNQKHDVIVELADGIYELEKPLHFEIEDAGLNYHTVTWRAAEDASPVISGGMQITGWSLYDKERNIYVASTAKGLNSRQLWVDDQRASRSQLEIPRSEVSFDLEGMTFNGESAALLSSLKGEEFLEVFGIQAFTNRISPVNEIKENRLEMTQPAWRNNIWGYDTIAMPLHMWGVENAKLFLRNALSFLKEPGEWYLNPNLGKLYLIPPEGKDIESLNVILPRLSYLVSVSGSDSTPLRDLRFKGLRFSYTSWLAPSGPEGYANQQSGSFITGETEGYPENPIANCSWGCGAFETRRNEWSQIPAAVQVSASERVTFDKNVFAHLGQVGLGVGNNTDANASGIGLGSRGTHITRNVFTDLSGGAILVGGIERDAHHPSTPHLANRNVVIKNNRIRSVSKEYQDNSAILSTYVDGALIVHNDISDAMYDAIDTGWGWGINDVGGNASYRRIERRHYDHLENLIYNTPTLHRNVTVAYNRIYDVKKFFHDGGAIYNLSASPGTRIYENYISDVGERIAIYMDEGSRGISIERNVVDGSGMWLTANEITDWPYQRITYDNVAIGNWHNMDNANGFSIGDLDNKILDDHLVKGQRWPKAAKKVMEKSGIQPSAGKVEYGDVR